MQTVFNRYINYLEAERNASPYTVRNYRTDLLGTYAQGLGKGFFQFLVLKRIDSLKAVDKQLIRDYIAWLMEQGTVRTSIARKLSAIRSFYRYLIREGIITNSPIPLTRRKGERSSFSPKLDKRIPSFLTMKEIEQLLAAPDLSKLEGQRDRAILELFYASGLRVSELAQLDVEQVNLDTREIRVLGKGSKERVVLMGEPAARALSAYIDSARPKLLGARKTSALFLSKSGRRLAVRSVQKLLKGYADSIGLDKRVHPHVLRHTFATHLLDGGADLRVVQQLLGHADLSSTQIYTHVTKYQARKVYLSAHPMALEKEKEIEHGEQNSEAAPAAD